MADKREGGGGVGERGEKGEGKAVVDSPHQGGTGVGPVADKREGGGAEGKREGR